MSSKVSRNFESQSLGILYSEILFNKMALYCAENEMIELTDKQLNTLKALEKTGGLSVASQKLTHRVLASSDHSMVKHLVMTPQIAGSPVRESNRASEQILKSLHIYQIMNYLLGKDDKDLKAAFLTFSFKNADLGHLTDAEQALNMIYKKLRRYMERTCDFGSAEYLGTLPSLEVTVNLEKLYKRDTRGLFHPHFHVVIFYSGEINLGNVYRQLWAKYKDLCDKANAKASAAAFLLEPTYDKDSENEEQYVIFDNGQQKQSKEKRQKGLLDSILEATKYETKPADLNAVAIDKKDPKPLKNFKAKAWAELYNSNVHPKLSENCPYKGIKEAKLIRNNGSGLFQLANQIYRAIVNAGLGGLFDFQPANGDLAKVPTVFTQAVQIDAKKIIKEQQEQILKLKQQGKSSSGYKIAAKIANISKLTSEEVLYYNRQILQKALFLPGLVGFKRAIAKAKSKFGLSNKSELIVDVLTNLPNWNMSEDDINEVIEDWVNTVIECTINTDTGLYNEQKVDDVKLLQQAYCFALNNEEYKRVAKTYHDFASGIFKRADENEITLEANGHVNFEGYDFAVRKWKNLDLAEKIAHKAKNDDLVKTIYNNNKLKAFYKQVLAGTANLRQLEANEKGSLTVHVIRQYVPLFVKLTQGLNMDESTESKYSYPINDWHFWEATSEATNSKLTGLTPQLQLLVACLLYAMDNDKYEEAVLCVGSASRTVQLEVDTEALKGMTNHLLKNNATDNNSLFKTYAQKHCLSWLLTGGISHRLVCEGQGTLRLQESFANAARQPLTW